MEMFRVGEANCSFNVICDILLEPDDGTAISFANIVDLALKLSIPTEIVQRLKFDYNTKGQSNLDSLHCVLGQWRCKFGKRATIAYLLTTLRSLELNLRAGQLEAFFKKRQISQREECVLNNDSIPSKDNYYISRMIIPRNLLDPEGIFKQHPDKDIFLFSGIERHELSAKAQCPTDTSDNQRHLRKLSVKYMVLSFDSDFVDISKKVNNPVHLIHHEDGKFFWIDSSKGFHTIQQAVSVSTQLCLDEEEFLQAANNMRNTRYQPVCIADTPGMGKSYLLANLARDIASRHKQRIIIFSDFSSFISKLPTNLVKDAKLEEAIRTVLTSLSQTGEKTKGNANEHIMHPKGADVEVMLDGFDEIPTKNKKLALQCLDVLKTLPTTRVWVTSRPHFLGELENCLHVLGYNIRPFTSQDQELFLVKFWSHGAQNLDSKRLGKYALACLEMLKVSMSVTEKHIAGIPLQCMLIATLYREEAVKYATIGNARQEISKPVIPKYSISSLFEGMIEYKLNAYFKRHLTSTKMHTREQLVNAHIIMSMQLLFPHFAETFRKLLSVDLENMLDGILEVGLVERRSRDEHPQFLHRLLAEYFVAQFISECIKSGSNGVKISSMCQLLFKSIAKQNQIDVIRKTYDLTTYNFSYLAICYFLDNMLESELANELHNLKLENVDAIRSCASHNLKNLFDFLVKATDFRNSEKDVFSNDLLLTGVMYSDVSLISRLSDLYKTSQKKTVRSISFIRKKKSLFQTSNIGHKFSLLHVAIRFRQYSVVEHLVYKHSFKDFLTNNHYRCQLLQYCVHKSQFDSDNLIEEKIESLRLLNLNMSMLQIWDNLYASMFKDNIHPRLENVLEMGIKMKIIRIFTRFSALRFLRWPALTFRTFR